jgi:hypothetical protein
LFALLWYPKFLFAFALKISITATSSPHFFTHWVRFGSSPHDLLSEAVKTHIHSQKEKHPSKDECFLFGCGGGHFFLLFAKQFTGISNLCFAKIFGHR